MNTELQETNTPGAVIAIVKGADILDAKTFGVADMETHAQFVPGMLFRLGSTTKMFTAATLVSLAESGKVDLKAPVGRYIKGLAPCLAKVTAHQLLTHTAGIIDEAPMFGSHDDSALKARVLSWKNDYCFDEPGKVFSYSNPAYVLAGYLAEVVGGKPFADVVGERILKPLGMESSTFRPTLAMTFPLAQGHDEKMHVIRPAADYAGAWPSGSLFSNVVDLARWTIALMNDGVLDGVRVLSPSLIAKLSTPYVDMPPARAPGKYGYGLEIQPGILQHAGSRAGYGTMIRIIPSQKVAIVILANRTGASLPKTLAAATAAFVTLPEETPQPKAVTDLKGAQGVYTNGPESIQIVPDGAHVAAIISGHRYQLEPSGNGFEVKGNGGRLAFGTGYVWLGSRAYRKQ